VGIELLGSVSIRNGETRHHIRAAKVRATLALLALNAGQVVSFNELVDELWMECSLQNARNALQANTLRLRRQLEAHAPDSASGQLVRTTGNGYVLDVPAQTVDVNRFQYLADRGSTLVERQPGEAIDLLQRALGLWRGPALVDAGDGFRCRASAAGLEERRITAQEDLIAAQLHVGGERGAVSDLRQLVARYPERERFREQLMLALYRCGRQTEALDVFHHTRQWLGSELGLKPHYSLHAMYRAILAQDPALHRA